VRRYHTWPMLRVQTVAEHSWRAATICMELFSGGGVSTALLTEILLHDCGEVATGDVPHMAKRDNATFREEINRLEHRHSMTYPVRRYNLTFEQCRILKTCDLLECWEHGMEEVAMGNGFGKLVCDNIEAAIQRLLSEDKCLGETALVWMNRRRRELS